MARFRPVLTDAEVTEQQWRVVRALADVAEATPSELAERCAILPPSMTRIVRTLVDRGFATRRSDRNDLRRTLLSITPAGRELVSAMSPQITAIYDEFNRRLGEPGLDELLERLDVLIAEPSGSRD